MVPRVDEAVEGVGEGSLPLGGKKPPGPGGSVMLLVMEM